MELRTLGSFVLLALGAQFVCGQSAPESFAYVLQAHNRINPDS